MGMSYGSSHAENRGRLNAYRDWRRRLARLAARDIPLPQGFKMAILFAVAIYIADQGNNGLDCFPSLTTIGRDLELNRDTVIKYRRALIRMGWFTARPNTGRKIVLDISQPADAQIITWVSTVQRSHG